MNNKSLSIVLVGLIFSICFISKAWAEEERNEIFSITPAISFSWYPFSDYLKQESAKIDADLNNFGVSVLMGLKLFDRIGAQLNLKIDDPTFQKMVDFAGYLNIYDFMLNFDYHNYSGTVTWEGNTPNPIKNESYNFYSKWTNISLLYNWLALVGLKDFPQFFALGVIYSSFEIPVEYRIKKDSGLKNPGFGMLKGNAWGMALFMDTLVGSMELSSNTKKLSLFPPVTLAGHNFDIWFYVDAFFGIFLQKAEIDADALAWMVDANGGVSIDGDVTRNFSAVYDDPDDYSENKPPLSIMKASIIVGLQKVWDVGKKGRIGLAVGLELRLENFFTSSNDIRISYDSMNIGPAVRFSARW